MDRQINGNATTGRDDCCDQPAVVLIGVEADHVMTIVLIASP